MNTRENVICRLCLKVPSNDFKVVDEVTQNILSNILLKVNLAVSDDPVICNSCAECVQKSYNFKTACVSTEDCLLFLEFAKGGDSLDLREVYLCESTNIPTTVDTDGGVCRFCLQQLLKGCYTPLDTLEKAMGIVSDMLPKYLPEINLNLTKEPLICTACLASLESHFSFAMVCWSVEDRIKKYLEFGGVNVEGKVKLIDVVQFTPTNTLDDPLNGEGDDTSIREDFLFRTDKEETDANLANTPNSDHPEKTCRRQTAEKFKHDDNQETVHVGLPEAITYKTGAVPPQEGTGISAPDLPYSCDKCEYKTKRKRHLKAHLFKHSDNASIRPYDTFKCPVCPYQGSKKFHLKRHLLVHRKPAQTVVYKCEVCAYQTRHRYRLKDHMITHMDPSVAPMFQCEVCGFRTKQKFCLRRHSLLHRPSVDSPKYRCEFCEFGARRKGSLEKHLKVHRDVEQLKKYKCDNCEYAAARMSRLKDHMLIHKDPSEVAMFKCELCSFETKKKFSLKRHLLVHERSDGTTYTCKSCPYKSTNRFDVRRHRLSHKAR